MTSQMLYCSVQSALHNVEMIIISAGMAFYSTIVSLLPYVPAALLSRNFTVTFTLLLIHAQGAQG